jgi:hypothetical protein
MAAPTITGVFDRPPPPCGAGGVSAPGGGTTFEGVGGSVGEVDSRVAPSAIGTLTGDV